MTAGKLKNKSGDKMDIARIQELIKQRVNLNRNEMAQTLSRLVQIPSVSGSEGEAQKFMAKLYHDLGLEVVQVEPDAAELAAHPDCNRLLETNFQGRPNVLGILPGKDSARSINLNGHIDTVPPDPIDQWQDPPFSGKIDGNRLYGRGALDNKGGLVANYFALKAILDAGYKPAGKVILESAVEEEVSGAGTFTTLLRGYVADAMLVNDGPPGVLVAHTGGVGRFKVRVIGRTMHAGWADLGVNAIIKMNKIVAALDDFGAKRTRENHLPVLETPQRPVSCTHNISVYHAGDNPGTVPGWAEITASFSFVPGENAPAIRQQIEDIINRTADADEWLKEHRPQITWLWKGYTSWLQDTRHPFVQAALKAGEKVTGQKPALGGMTAGSDVRFAQLFNVPAILTGPRGLAHAVNEYVEIDSLVANAQIIALLVADWCGLEKL